MKIDVWQVWVEPTGWRYATPGVAAMVATYRPGNARLVTIEAPRLHWSRDPRTKVQGVTPRRLKAAESALQRQCDRVPLFVGYVAKEQPTAIGRIEMYDRAMTSFLREQRTSEAHAWRKARKILAAMAPLQRAHLICQWNEGYQAQSGTSLVTYLHFKLGTSPKVVPLTVEGDTATDSPIPTEAEAIA